MPDRKFNVEWASQLSSLQVDLISGLMQKIFCRDREWSGRQAGRQAGVQTWVVTQPVMLYLYVFCSLLLCHASEADTVRQECGLKGPLLPLCLLLCL